MVGKWKLEKRDPNFEEFLVCRQVISEVLIMAKCLQEMALLALNFMKNLV